MEKQARLGDVVLVNVRELGRKWPLGQQSRFLPLLPEPLSPGAIEASHAQEGIVRTFVNGAEPRGDAKAQVKATLASSCQEKETSELGRL